jgi:hypothetical protein
MVTAVTLIGNFVIASFVLALVFYGKITWTEGMAFVGTLLFPSAGSVLIARQQTAKLRARLAQKAVPPNLMLCTIALLFFVAGCPQSANGPTADADASGVEASAPVTPILCVALQGLTGSNTVETICAAVEEVAQVVSLILTLRQGDAGAPANCTIIPKTTLCATGREIGQGIEFLIRKRQSTLMLDGGK